jgi:hypothetical protein
MEGESTESVVQGVSTKDHEIGLKYRESGSLIEKGCTERTAVTPAIQYDNSVPKTGHVCARKIAKVGIKIPKKYGKWKYSKRGSKHPHTGRTVGTPFMRKST